MNNYRKHLDKTKFDLEEILTVTNCDFELGGIMNPFNQIGEGHILYENCKNLFPSFPYISRLDIQSYIYKDSFDQIFNNLQKEIISEISILVTTDSPYLIKSIDAQKFTGNELENLKEFQFYQKTVALHLCGLGDTLLDAFNKILSRFIGNEKLSQSMFK